MEILKLFDHTTNTWKAVPAIKGEQGDSGVYYGTDTPPAGTKVWIDPSGTADQLPEEGTDYIKFPGGTLICWGYYNGGTQSTSGVGYMYRATLAVNQVFPIPFVEIPHVSASNKDGYGIMGEIDVTTTAITSISLLRPNSGSIYPRIYWTAIGRWK